MTRLPLALLAVCAAWLCADAATVVPMRRAATFWRTETREAKPDPLRRRLPFKSLGGFPKRL